MSEKMFRSSNPALNNNTFVGYDTNYEERMTLEGTANKTLILLSIVVCIASIIWSRAYSSVSQGELPAIVFLSMAIGSIGGLVMLLVTIFSNKKNAIYTTILYAVFQGLFIGGVSTLMEFYYPNIVIQAVMLTFGVFLIILVIYRMNLISASENFRIGMYCAFGSIFLVYIITAVMWVIGVKVPFIHSSGPIGIAFSLIVCGIAALSFVLDFDFIEKGAKFGAPKHLEWYAAFGLMVSLIWLYVEILHLLAKLRNR